MCIAILQPQNKTLSKDTLHTCWENNSHGGGILYNSPEGLQVFKEINNFDKWYSKYSELISDPMIAQKQMILHFRIMTHGEINEDNTHPFLVNPNLGFAHNGTIRPVTGKTSKDKSDTSVFSDMLSKLPKGFLNNETIVELISEYIGYSKLVFLDSRDNSWIINSAKGEWGKDQYEGFWFSNGSYKEKKVTVHSGNGGWQSGRNGNAYSKSYTDTFDTTLSGIEACKYTTENFFADRSSIKTTADDTRVTLTLPGKAPLHLNMADPMDVLELVNASSKAATLLEDKKYFPIKDILITLYVTFDEVQEFLNV